MSQERVGFCIPPYVGQPAWGLPNFLWVKPHLCKESAKRVTPSGCRGGPERLSGWVCAPLAVVLCSRPVDGGTQGRMPPGWVRRVQGAHVRSPMPSSATLAPCVMAASPRSQCCPAQRRALLCCGIATGPQGRCVPPKHAPTL